ncbi:MAG: virulence-associated E family protein [Clostridia bacterium]
MPINLPDPILNTGIVGTFCRLYGIPNAIDTFLKDVYTHDTGNKFSYSQSTLVGKAYNFKNKFLKSNYPNDPAFGQWLNSFDLVRVHKFADPDPNKSYQMMEEFVLGLEEVQIALYQEKKTAVIAKDWKALLQYNPKTCVINNTVRNLTLILQHDQLLKNIQYNSFSHEIVITGKLPWATTGSWSDSDDAQLKTYLEITYGSFSNAVYDTAFTTVIDDRQFHPVLDYLNNLPLWDGCERAETLFIDYLGVADSPYTRAVTRKWLCAAVRRIQQSGIKFDYVPILTGDQGIGKSTLISKLAGEWFSDSLTLSDMESKAAAEKLQGAWIVEIAELSGIKKAEQENIKQFISTTDDKYRASYAKRVVSHPRQCVFVGTTNAADFLRDSTGNRRFWVLQCDSNSTKKPWDLTKSEVDQIWAEVKLFVEKGEDLFLDPNLEAQAENIQTEYLEEDARLGLVEEYLNKLLPDDWDNMDLTHRLYHLAYPSGKSPNPATVVRTHCSNLEVFSEALGNPKQNMTSIDSYKIAMIMKKLGWVKAGRKKLPIYGQQRIYTRP